MEHDFKILYKPSRSHLMGYALSRLPNNIELLGILDQIFDANLFALELEWL